MNISSFTSPGTDRFGRKYPIKITFIDNRILFGHIKSSIVYENTTTNIHFLTRWVQLNYLCFNIVYWSFKNKFINELHQR
jgi:hypothetical protein